jgi:hypothetical protein
VGAKALQPDARSLASQACKRSVGDEVQKFDGHLAEETNAQWVFVCKDLDAAPPPRADGMVLVRTADGSAEVVPGR